MDDFVSNPTEILVEIRNVLASPADNDRQLALTTRLPRWTIRTGDDLPGGRDVRKRLERSWEAQVPSRQPMVTGGADA